MRKKKKKVEVFPFCDREDCRANKRCECVALTDNNFGDRDCPFYKRRDDDKAGTSAIQKD